MEPCNSDGKGKGGSSNSQAKPVLETSFKNVPWLKDLTAADDLACEEPPSDFNEIPTLTKEGIPSFDQGAKRKAIKGPQTSNKRAESVVKHMILRERVLHGSKSDIGNAAGSSKKTTAIKQLPVNSGLGGNVASKAAYTPGKIQSAPVQLKKQASKSADTAGKVQSAPKRSWKQTIKPADTRIVRQDTFVLDKPTLAVHVPTFLPTVASTTTKPADTATTSNTPASKIPLPKTGKTNIPNRIRPLKRTPASKESSTKLGQNSSAFGGVAKKKK